MDFILIFFHGNMKEGKAHLGFTVTIEMVEFKDDF